MPHSKIDLADGRTIDLLYLQKTPELGDLIYLQSIRSGLIEENSVVAQAYQAKVEPIYTVRLADLVTKCGFAFDALVCAPSSRNDGQPYFQRLQEWLQIKDLSERFSKCGSVRSAETSCSLEDLFVAISYEAAGDEASFNGILIVDDSFATGSTIIAMLRHLQNAGLKDCAVTVAVPALLNA